MINFDINKVYISYENYKGGINNLIVAQYGLFGEVATSQISKEVAIKNLKRKLRKNILNWNKMYVLNFGGREKNEIERIIKSCMDE